MTYQLSEADVAFLRSRYGSKALENASELALTASSLLGDLTTLRARYPEHAAALAETVRARRRAAGKLRHAEALIADETAVQQATAAPVAALRAADIVSRHRGAVVHDITCSIGGELLALAGEPGLAGVIGSDVDPVRLAMAQHNLDVGLGAGRRPTLLRADALTPVSIADVVIADPGRRNARGRVFGMDQLDPPLLELLSVYAGRALAVKCAPGLDYRNLRTRFGFDGQVQVVSLDGGVREAVLWTELPEAPANRASVLRTAPGGLTSLYEVTSDDPDDLPEPGVDEWIVDPDGAVVRAGLVRQYAHARGLRQLDPQIAYLTGDAVPAGERGFRVLERLPVTEKVLRGALAARGCGSLEILVRGLDVDPDRLRKRLRLKGDAPYALILTRIGRTGAAFLCEPGVRA
ncbi:THUMP-like domain-containing protein [Gordonia sp. (in: high G+C Gram-positive bacteria)]|uniref:THUMP-like domain-containing protein n=1 Tax=unclassified Gordonia (in: high G+C Gram-positive bacteria) TaxID=2657482 RepID=UPI00261414A5|nr:class I SAM-dependent methyltransferase [Gordonia sp. (in: high G+C Gram-positive bacteria)]